MRAVFVMAALSAAFIAAAPALAQTQEQVAALPPAPDAGFLGGGWETVDPASIGIGTGTSAVEPRLYQYEADLADPGDVFPDFVEVLRPPEERQGEPLTVRGF